MKKYICLLPILLGLHVATSAQTSSEQPEDQLQQMQRQMQEMFQNFSFQFGDENMLMDTMIFRQFDMNGLDSLGGMQFHNFGNENFFSEDFSQQMQEMIEQLMKNFEGFEGFDSEMSPFFFHMDPSLPIPDSLRQDGLKKLTPKEEKDKRKTHKL